MNSQSFPGLAIRSPLISPESPNHCPPSWPPPKDWPVIIDENGAVVCRWLDHRWILDVWAGTRLILNFGDGPAHLTVKCESIDNSNANLLRLVVGWWLYGTSRVVEASTLFTRFQAIRKIFSHCTKAGILASDLERYPAVWEELSTLIPSSTKDTVIAILHEIQANSSAIGFEIGSTRMIMQLAAQIPDLPHSQTAYIPPRIWKYQVARLQEFLDDFIAHKTELENAFQFCLDAYIKSYGSLEEATRPGRYCHLRPFIKKRKENKGGGRDRLAFEEVAERFGIESLLKKWIRIPNGGLRTDCFANYFSIANWAGIAFIINFTLMRADEAMSLKADCFTFDEDPRFGRIYLIKGSTSKTIKDDEAYWVTSELVGKAIEVVNLVGTLRRRCCLSHSSDRLLQRPTEPWGGGAPHINDELRPEMPEYSKFLRSNPSFLDEETIRVTQQDLDLARLVTPTLKANIVVGQIWPFSWHQFRRTGAVNMQASGLITDASLQFQLKHLSRAMSLYYGQNYSRVRLNETANEVYVRAMYETLGRELQIMTTDRFISPHGQKRKDEIVRLISRDDLKKAISLAKRGGVACREILLGACLNTDPCPYGGIDSVAHCGGGDTGKPCADVLYDTTKKPKVVQLDKLLTDRIKQAPDNSPLHESLQAQKRSVKNYLENVQAIGETA